MPPALDPDASHWCVVYKRKIYIERCVTTFVRCIPCVHIHHLTMSLVCALHTRFTIHFHCHHYAPSPATRTVQPAHTSWHALPLAHYTACRSVLRAPHRSPASLRMTTTKSVHNIPRLSALRNHLASLQLDLLKLYLNRHIDNSIRSTIY